MPIKRLLMERARLPRRGVIRLGVATRCGKPRGQCGWCWEKDGTERSGHGKEVDYFVLPPELRPTLGEQPKRLRVMLPLNDPDLVLVASYVKYQGKQCVLKCDGETAVHFPIEGKEARLPCRKPPVVDGKPTPCPEGCKAEGRFNVILVDAPLGVWQVVMGGEQRLADLLTELHVYQQMFGRLTDIPFELERVSQQGSFRDAQGKRMARTGYPVHLRCNFTAAQARQLRGLEPEALPPATEEDEEEVAGLHVPEGGPEPAVAMATPPPAASSPAVSGPTTPPEDIPPKPANVPAGYQFLDGEWRDPRVQAAAAPGAERAILRHVDPAEEFDISMAYREAVLRCQVTAEEYSRYLERMYGGADNMTVEHLDKERLWYEKCRDNGPGEAQRWRQAILAGATRPTGIGQGRLL